MLCEEKNGLRQVKAIVHWQHQRGEEAHCSVRVYADLLNQRTVVLLSQIRSNPRVTGLMSDLEGVANTLWNCIGIILLCQPIQCAGLPIMAGSLPTTR